MLGASPSAAAASRNAAKRLESRENEEDSSTDDEAVRRVLDKRSQLLECEEEPTEGLTAVVRRRLAKRARREQDELRRAPDATLRQREQERCWREVLQQLDAVSRGALKAEALPLALSQSLGSVVDWGAGTPHGNALLRDLAALCSQPSRLAPPLEQADAALQLARKALRPGQRLAEDESCFRFRPVRSASADEALHADEESHDAVAALAKCVQQDESDDDSIVLSSGGRPPSSQSRPLGPRAASQEGEVAVSDEDLKPVMTRAKSGLDDSSRASTRTGGRRSPDSRDSGNASDDNVAAAAVHNTVQQETATLLAAGQACAELPQAQRKGRNSGTRQSGPGDWTSLPLSELDFGDDSQFAAEARRTPSYRRLPPSVPRAVCSHRTATDAAVLNDDWVSVATASEDAAFPSQLQLRRNAHEEALFKAEDEHFEIDMVIATNASASRALNAIARRFHTQTSEDDDLWWPPQQQQQQRAQQVSSRVKPDYSSKPPRRRRRSESGDRSSVRDRSPPPVKRQRALSACSQGDAPQLPVESSCSVLSSSSEMQQEQPPQLAREVSVRSFLDDDDETCEIALPRLDRRALSPIHLGAICRVYGERDCDALKALRRAPHLAALVVARRLDEKDLEWRAARCALSRRWRRRVKAHFAKSLDHRAHFWRALDKKRCSSKWLVQEIKELSDDDTLATLIKTQEVDASLSDEAAYETVVADAENRGVEPSLGALRYDVSCDETQRDAFIVLMLALEHSTTPAREQRAVVRDVWRDLVAPLYGVPCKELAPYLPQSLSRDEPDDGDVLGPAMLANSSSSSGQSGTQSPVSFVESQFEQPPLAAAADHSEDKPASSSSPVLVPQQGLQRGTRVLTPFGEGLVLDCRQRTPSDAPLSREDEDEDEDEDEVRHSWRAVRKSSTKALKPKYASPDQVEGLLEGESPRAAQQCSLGRVYELRLERGVALLRPKDVFALDDQPDRADTLFPGYYASAGGEQRAVSPATAGKKKSQSKKRTKQTSQANNERALAAEHVMQHQHTSVEQVEHGTPVFEETEEQDPRCALDPSTVQRWAMTRLGSHGACYANERLYVFARLHQMVYARLADAKRLCELESQRKQRAVREPHEVADAIAADDEGEPGADSSDDDAPLSANGKSLAQLASALKLPAASAKSPPPEQGLEVDEPRAAARDVSCDETDDEIKRCCAKGYSGFLELVAMLLCGDVNKQTFDEACRELLGNDGYRVRALDKLARATVDAMRALAADESFALLRGKHHQATRDDLDHRQQLAQSAPTMLNDDLYKVVVAKRDQPGHTTLVLEFLGVLEDFADDPMHLS